jgi:hypothetical protein
LEEIKTVARAAGDRVRELPAPVALPRPDDVALRLGFGVHPGDSAVPRRLARAAWPVPAAFAAGSVAVVAIRSDVHDLLGSGLSAIIIKAELAARHATQRARP